MVTRVKQSFGSISVQMPVLHSFPGLGVLWFAAARAFRWESFILPSAHTSAQLREGLSSVHITVVSLCLLSTVHFVTPLGPETVDGRYIRTHVQHLVSVGNSCVRESPPPTHLGVGDRIILLHS
jgi:hypothetical protein